MSRVCVCSMMVALMTLLAHGTAATTSWLSAMPAVGQQSPPADESRGYEYASCGVGRACLGYEPSEEDENLLVSNEILGNITNPIRYGGYFHDNETGLYHVRHRMYQPQSQRWLQRDPVGVNIGNLYPAGQYRDGMSAYQYVGSRPVRAVDPFGLCPCEKSQRNPHSAMQCCSIYNVLIKGCLDSFNICAQEFGVDPTTYGLDAAMCAIACLPLLETGSGYYTCLGACEGVKNLSNFYWWNKCMEIPRQCMRNANAMKRSCIDNAYDCDQFDPGMSCPSMP